MLEKRIPRFSLVLALLLPLLSCGGSNSSSTGSPPLTGVLAHYTLTGDVQYVRDPSVIRQGTTYYQFGTDNGAPGSNYILIRCSSDRLKWTICGHIFDQIPAWVTAAVPGVVGLWAPDISFFNGLYHVYYAGSTFASNRSVIGLATNPTLDPSAPSYHWTDRGEVLGSIPTDDFNAIDPSLLVDGDGTVWMTYGSFWTGIKQRQIDPATGMLLASNPTIHSLATRPNVQFNPIEGSSLVHHGAFYYLFASFDFCCNPDPYQCNYRIMVGRSTSVNGPFTDENGAAMLQGGGTPLLAGNGSTWNAPGGETVYLDQQEGDLIVFHAIQLPSGIAWLFANRLTWVNDWPSIQP
jgi:arabinan endo-1,5-alpha-L-arabinosidase